MPTRADRIPSSRIFVPLEIRYYDAVPGYLNNGLMYRDPLPKSRHRDDCNPLNQQVVVSIPAALNIENRRFAETVFTPESVFASQFVRFLDLVKGVFEGLSAGGGKVSTMIKNSAQ